MVPPEHAEGLQSFLGGLTVTSLSQTGAQNQSGIQNIPLSIEGQMKSFPDRKRPKEFTTINAVLQEMLKGLLPQEEEKDKK